MFHGMISPGYSELIQDNLWRINPWHRGNIQDNGLVWHLGKSGSGNIGGLCLDGYDTMQISNLYEQINIMISWHLIARVRYCSGSLEPETLWSRSEALHEYGVIHGGWHFNIHQDFDTRGR